MRRGFVICVNPKKKKNKKKKTIKEEKCKGNFFGKMERGGMGLKRLILHSRKVQKHKYKEPHLPLKKWKTKKSRKNKPTNFNRKEGK